MTLPASALPAPDDSVLKYIALGVGHQNYTCANATAQAVPASAGAVAKLYDADPLLQNDQSRVATLPGNALKIYRTLANPPAALSLIPGGYKVLGDHYFSPPLIPTFDLWNGCSGTPKLYAKKANGTKAPDTSVKGTRSEGAVDWLLLVDAGNSVGGINRVYRVETAGGMAPTTCEGVTGPITVPYAAEYWFYVPK